MRTLEGPGQQKASRPLWKKVFARFHEHSAIVMSLCCIAIKMLHCNIKIVAWIKIRLQEPENE